jgi:hypothetical protein
MIVRTSAKSRLIRPGFVAGTERGDRLVGPVPGLVLGLVPVLDVGLDLVADDGTVRLLGAEESRGRGQVARLVHG